MKLETTIKASLLLLLSASSFASVNQCCNQIAQKTGSFNSVCDSEEAIADEIGRNITPRTSERFGVSKQSQRLPIVRETLVNGSTRPIKNVQNVGFLLTPESNLRLKAVVPAFKYTDSWTGTSCTAVSYNSLDSAHLALSNLKKYKGRKKPQTAVPTPTPQAPKGCLLSINNLNSILKSGQRAKLKSTLASQGIKLVSSSTSGPSQIKVSIRGGGLVNNGGQYDLRYQKRGGGIFSNNKKTLAKMQATLDLDYGFSGTKSVRLTKTFDITRVTNNDQLDFAVLKDALSGSIDVNKCKKVKR